MIIFLHGEDTYRSREKLKQLKDKFLRDVDQSGNSFVLLEGEKVTMEKINEAISTSSLFASKRMVVIENIFSNKSKALQDKLSEYIGNYDNNDNIIIFWDDTDGKGIGKNKLYNKLSNLKYEQNFKKLSNTAIVSWVRNEVEKRGAKISQALANDLTSIFNNDLWSLSKEIDKLISYVQAKNKNLKQAEKDLVISKGDLHILAIGSIEGNVFALTDAISANNKKQAMELLENEIASGSADVYLLSMIIRQFKILIQVRQAVEMGLAQNQIARNLHLHPYVVQKCSNQVRNYSINYLKKIFNGLIAVDAKIKTGNAEMKSEISLMISEM